MNWANSSQGVVKSATNWLTDLSDGALPANCDRVGPPVYDPRPENKGRLWSIGSDTADNKFSRLMYSDDYGTSWTEFATIPDSITSGTLNPKLNMTSDGILIWTNGVLIGRTDTSGTSTDEGDFQPSEYLVSNGGGGFDYNWQWGEFNDGTVITGAYANPANAAIQTVGLDDLSGLDMWRSTDGAAANAWEHLDAGFNAIYPPVANIIQHWHYVSVDPFTSDGWACVGDGAYNYIHRTTDKFDTIAERWNEDFVGLGFTQDAIWGGEDVRNGTDDNRIRVLDKNNISAEWQTAYTLPDDLLQQTIFYIKSCGNELWAQSWHHGETTASTIFKFRVNGTSLSLMKRFPGITDNTNTDLKGFSDMNGIIPEWSPFVYVHVWGEGEAIEKTLTTYRISRQ